MTHKLKTEMFSQKIEYSDGVFFWPLTPLFSFVSFHLKYANYVITLCVDVHKNVAFSNDEIMTFWCKICK